MVDDQAEEARSPAAARALACKMRLRAAELEGAGSRSSALGDAAIRLLADMLDEDD